MKKKGVLLLSLLFLPCVFGWILWCQPLVKYSHSLLEGSKTELPTLLSEAIQGLEQERFELFAAKRVVSEVRNTKSGYSSFQLSWRVWAYSQKLWLSDKEVLSLYCHSLPLGGCKGIAEHFFGKELDKLSRKQLVGVLVIGYAPSRYSPTQRPKDFADAVLRRMSKLGWSEKH